MHSSPLLLVDPLAPMPSTTEQFLEIVLGYVALLGADYQAAEQGLLPSAAPVDYLHLLALGVETDVLRWMLYQAHVDHFVLRLPDGEKADPVPRPSAVVDKGSAFALTPLGKAFAELLVGMVFVPQDNQEVEAAWAMLRVGKLVPRYDKENRLLLWGRHLLKSYLQPSANQELILLTAEKLGWVAWFDDPLPDRGQLHAKVRLHDTIKNLNRHQSPHLVRFKGDGTGTRVGWELR
jgi:hypothetical protein